VIDHQRDAVVGVVAVNIDAGHVFHSKAVLFATGGWGRVWEITSNAHALTGDGNALTYRRGVPMQDMEFFQCHPTGIYKMGILITEGVRGEGGVLLNDRGERFMERYAPNIKDLASRDVVSRAIHLEIQAGRGIKGKNYVYLDVTPETVNRYLAEAGGRAASTASISNRGCRIFWTSAGHISPSIRCASRCRSSRQRITAWAASPPISTAA
jgi:succinate dehydrogenase / fumarate reductase flavoprotein subunit